MALEHSALWFQFLGQQIQQRGLSLAVLADDRDSVAHLDAQGQVLDQGLVGVVGELYAVLHSTDELTKECRCGIDNPPVPHTREDVMSKITTEELGEKEYHAYGQRVLRGFRKHLKRPKLTLDEAHNYIRERQKEAAELDEDATQEPDSAFMEYRENPTKEELAKVYTVDELVVLSGLNLYNGLCKFKIS